MNAGNWMPSSGAARLTRRRFTGTTALTGLAAAAAGIVGCSSNNANKNNNSGAKASATAPGTSGTALSAATSRSGTPGAPPTAGRTSTPAAVDPTKGKPGGSLKAQIASYPSGLTVVDRKDPTTEKFTSLAHSGLLGFRWYRLDLGGSDISVEPDLAQAVPEQPDQTSYVFKLRQAAFHNGRTVTASDVAYSYDRYANYDKSAFKTAWTWFDSVQTPDPQTVIVKTKTPYADGILAMTAYQDGFVLAKEFEESADAATKMMGSGPFLFGDTTAPVTTTFKKNPNYFQKPYPYFDEIQWFSVNDPAKSVADFISKNVHTTWWKSEEPRDQIKQSRPDALLWTYGGPGHAAYYRTDQPPFNDKRVRQALSMALDRKAIRASVSKGEGADDQPLSPTNAGWGFRQPKDLGAAAKYWTFEPQAAKQLLAAAGFDKPIESQMTHWDAAPIGQAFVDTANLVQAQWKQAGLANIKDVTVTAPQYVTTASVGNYDGIAFGPGFLQTYIVGKTIHDQFFGPPEGIHPPTSNRGHVTDVQLNPLLDKQLTQLNLDDRKQTFRAIEDILAEQQYQTVMSTYSLNWFGDPSLRDAVIPAYAFSGTGDFLKHWWFA